MTINSTSGNEYAGYIDFLLPIIAEASAAVMAIYRSPGATTISIKNDTEKSPVTNADHAANSIIINGLSSVFAEIPVVSEEADVEVNRQSILSDEFWIIDPLDGTKEFIKRNGQFAICVALIRADKPVFGIVAAPALGRIYYGGLDMGSYMMHANATSPSQIRVAEKPTGIIYGSISHRNSETDAYINTHYPDTRIEPYGSQLKFTMVAAGRGDAYPRLNTTMKTWDVAAGHAIVEGAGGTVTRPDGTALSYKSPDFLAGDFVASR